jgi:hypothetical protein
MELIHKSLTFQVAVSGCAIGANRMIPNANVIPQDLKTLQGKPMGGIARLQGKLNAVLQCFPPSFIGL